MLDELELQNRLQSLIGGDDLEALDDHELVAARTFEDVGMLTRNAGLVLRFDDGTEFQITIVQSR